jgi:fructokinase
MERHTSDSTRRPPSVLTCGFVALDTLVQEDVLGYTAGGTAGNVAAALSFFGWRSSVAAVVGVDEAGTRLRRDLARAGVDTRHVSARREATTPQVIHELVDHGHRYHFRCYDCGRRLAKSRPPSEELAATILEHEPDPDVFFFDRASRFAVTLAEAYSDRGTIVLFEPATRGRAELVARAYAAATFVKCADDSPTDVRPLLRLRDKRTFILTSGASGVRFRHGPGSVRHLPAPSPTAVVDTAGAGDWTTAGFLQALLARDAAVRTFGEGEIEQALEWAQATAALSVAWRGARGMARRCKADDVVRDVSRILAGSPSAPTAAERFRIRVSEALCRVCLSPAQSPAQ